MQDLLSLSIFGGFVGFVAVTVVLIFLFFYAEYQEQGIIALVAFLAYFLVNHYWGNVPIINLFSIKTVSIYLATGLVYAVIKTYFYGREIAINGLDPKYSLDGLKGNVFRWWFIWPVSLISWLVSGLLKELFGLIWDNISKSFSEILYSGYKSKKKS